MPSFSPDGTMIAFNWYDKIVWPHAGRRELRQRHEHRIERPGALDSPSLFVGWPWITPDNRRSRLRPRQHRRLCDGYQAASGSPERPVDRGRRGDRESAAARAREQLHEGRAGHLFAEARSRRALPVFPTISPIQAGGYFWVFFTSRRTYGNAITQVVDDAVTKKIWVSAINIRPGADIIEDPSNPPFYLPGQEDAAGNVRGFAALEP
jgi:hypothetical protein